MDLLSLPDLVLDTLFKYFDVPSLLNMRLVSQGTKEYVEQPSQLRRIHVNIKTVDTFHHLHKSHIEWTNFKITILLSDPRIKEWSDNFTLFLQTREPYINSIVSDKCLTFPETSAILSLPELHSFSSVGYHYCSIQTEASDPNVINISHDTNLVKLTSLRLEGCTSLGNFLEKAVNLKYLCVTSGTWPDYTNEPRQWREWDYSKSVLGSIMLYIRTRFYSSSPSTFLSHQQFQPNVDDNARLIIDFGSLRQDRLTLTKEKLVELCELCYPVGVRLRNIRSLPLPMIKDVKATPRLELILGCVSSVLIESSVRGRFIPKGAVLTCGLNMSPYSPNFFQLPPDSIREISIFSVHPEVTNAEMEQVLRPRVDLVRLSILCDMLPPQIETVLSFSFFQNLEYLRVQKFSIEPQSFWELCDQCKRLKTLDVGGISETHLLGPRNDAHDSVGILALKCLETLILRNCQLGAGSLNVLSTLRLKLKRFEIHESDE